MKTLLQVKARYSDKELATFEAFIDQKLEQARTQFAFYRSQIDDLRSSADAKPKNIVDASVSSATEQLYTVSTSGKDDLTFGENQIEDKE